MKKKEYVAPSMDVMEMELQGSLLAGSTTLTGESVEDANTNNFVYDWE